MASLVCHEHVRVGIPNKCIVGMFVHDIEDDADDGGAINEAHVVPRARKPLPPCMHENVHSLPFSARLSNFSFSFFSSCNRNFMYSGLRCRLYNALVGRWSTFFA
eukprot:TRINITY_DN844_c0_g2_i1.p1 TRINITY_DN844_c0_g2~~TRINITY_DN844_c0_g2_i1.p1  ORF type:complete len:105 (-),score=15.87 TRINITY_DN844_c0_g2_i1:105-419(-)